MDRGTGAEDLVLDRGDLLDIRKTGPGGSSTPSMRSPARSVAFVHAQSDVFVLHAQGLQEAGYCNASDSDS